MTLSRLNLHSLADAYEALKDIHTWQMDHLVPVQRRLPDRRKVTLSPSVTHSKRKPFVFDDEE
jgi:hypothetical protein